MKQRIYLLVTELYASYSLVRSFSLPYMFYRVPQNFMYITYIL